MFDHLFAMSDAGVQVFVRQDQDATTKVQRGHAQSGSPRAAATPGRRRATSSSTAGWCSATAALAGALEWLTSNTVMNAI